MRKSAVTLLAVVTVLWYRAVLYYRTDAIAHWIKAHKEIQQEELLTGQLSG